MQIHTKRINEVKHFARVRGKGGKRINLPIYHVNFEAIENMPTGKLEEEILRKVTIAPPQLDALIQDEERSMINEAIEKAGFKRIVRKCLKLHFDQYNCSEIGRILNLHQSSVSWHLSQALPKVNAYILKHYPESK